MEATNTRDLINRGRLAGLVARVPSIVRARGPLPNTSRARSSDRLSHAQDTR